MAGFETLPILASKDLDETQSFYTKLGFDTIYHDPAPTGYLIMRGHDIELHFFPFPDLDPATNYCGTYIRGRALERLYEKLEVATHLPINPSGIPRAMPPEDKPWGMKEFHIVDRSGNLLRFGQEL